MNAKNTDRKFPRYWDGTDNEPNSEDRNANTLASYERWFMRNSIDPSDLEEMDAYFRRFGLSDLDGDGIPDDYKRLLFDRYIKWARGEYYTPESVKAFRDFYCRYYRG